MSLYDVDFLSLSGAASGNVVQSFAPYNGGEFVLCVHATGDDNVLSIANSKRPSVSLAATSAFGSGHGQTLVHEIGDIWWLESAGDGTITRVTLSFDGSSLSRVDGNNCRLYPPEYTGNLTMGQSDGDLLVSRSNGHTDGNQMRVWNKSDIIAEFGSGNMPTPLQSWQCPDTTIAGDYFQGCTIFDGSVFVLNGRTLTTEPNTLRRFSLSGELQGETVLTELSYMASRRGTKQEPECLCVFNGQLYFAIMLGSSGANQKYLVNARHAIGRM